MQKVCKLQVQNDKSQIYELVIIFCSLQHCVHSRLLSLPNNLCKRSKHKKMYCLITKLDDYGLIRCAPNNALSDVAGDIIYFGLEAVGGEYSKIMGL